MRIIWLRNVLTLYVLNFLIFLDGEKKPKSVFAHYYSDGGTTFEFINALNTLKGIKKLDYFKLSIIENFYF